jgi:hypothetical protein
MRNIIDVFESELKLIRANKDDVRGGDLPKFMKDYKKFKELVDKEDVKGNLKRALDKIDVWVKKLDKLGGLPFAYSRYEQFTWVMASFDDEANKGRGGLYDKDVIDSIIKYWKDATGYEIHDIYKDLR